MSNHWKFIDDDGCFELASPQNSSYLYFPLANESGMMSSITPTLKGDIKTGQNTFFALPVSADDLHNLKSGRNFWVMIDGKGAWSATGASSLQIACDADERVKLQAGFLWHRVIRENSRLGIKSEITNFVPVENDQVELMRVRITNTGTQKLTMTPTAAIPVYGRSADNVRDHRHVSGLLGRVYTTAAGIEVQPAMTFDERGHKRNSVTYNVWGVDDLGNKPIGSFPSTEEFIGEGGCLEWPEAVVRNLAKPSLPGEIIEGYEAIGALRFQDEVLLPGQSKTYIIVLSVTNDRVREDDRLHDYLNTECFQRHLDGNIAFWEEKLNKIRFGSSNTSFDLLMMWVNLQPVLRRIYGCSFMPHHDYGKGGRGWRDLWQDCLALLLLEPETARSQLLNNFGGVRLDGTNATIIGKASGEFVADRNNISRVWSDHGVWPLFTTLLYIHNSGDIDFLFEQQSYFKDRLAMRSREADIDWTPAYGNKQQGANGEVYTGTILEHLMLQNLTAFYNVGSHNNVRLENADWNDGLDMAYDQGETVAFTSFYAGNLMELGKLLHKIKTRKAVDHIEISSEIATLFDTLNVPVDYNSVEAKKAALLDYYQICRHNISGEKVSCDIDRLSLDLEKKAQWLMDHIRKNELVQSKDGYEWFNGYYDNAGKQVEGETPSGLRMTLTGQVFPVMMGIATQEQVAKVVAACRQYLFDERLGGYRLNTNFNEVKLDLGRCFGYAFGHKENGAIFSHMAVMYAYALYRRGFVTDGYEVICSLYDLSTDFDRARIYPGIPEYFNEKGRGMYHYLTGSASWFLLVMLGEVYGIKGKFGDLVLQPKLKDEQFDASMCASVQTVFAGRKLKVIYRNEEYLDYGKYEIGCISIDNGLENFKLDDGAAVVDRNSITRLSPDDVHTVEVMLVEKFTK
jgi:cellobiose phosphorylase